MITHILLGGCDLYVTSVTPYSGRACRRDAEIEAVARLVEYLAGPEARLMHHSDGSPYISGFSRAVSVSHSEAFALLAAAPDGVARIGVDIDSPRTQLFRVAPRFLSASELESYGGDLDSLLMAWTSKEALYKIAGISGLDLCRDISLPELSPREWGCCEAEVLQLRFRLYTAGWHGSRIALAVPCESVV